MTEVWWSSQRCITRNHIRSQCGTSWNRKGIFYLSNVHVKIFLPTGCELICLKCHKSSQTAPLILRNVEVIHSLSHSCQRGQNASSLNFCILFRLATILTKCFDEADHVGACSRLSRHFFHATEPPAHFDNRYERSLMLTSKYLLFQEHRGSLVSRLKVINKD